MVPAVGILLAGCSIHALVDQRGAEGTGSVVSVCVAMLILVPARGIAQFENVELMGDEAKYTHARNSVSSRSLDRHSADPCTETLRWILKIVAGRADCHVD